MLVLIALMLMTVLSVSLGDKLGLPWPAILTLVTTAFVFLPGIPLIEFPPEYILPIFLPPLLWALAWQTSWGVIREQWLTILIMAVGLVALTTVTVGVTAWALVPSLTVAMGMLIGAAAASTDPVAVDAIAEPAGIPRRIVSTLQIEGLLNDAASIVAFNMAMTAVLAQGSFTGKDAFIDFLYSGGVAVIIGLLIGRVVAWLHGRVDDSTARTILTWLAPFAAWMLAEQIGTSGAITVVVAGVEMHSRVTVEAEERLNGRSFWEVVELMFTGIAFGLIGMSVRVAYEKVGNDLWYSVGVGVVLSIVAFIARGIVVMILYWVNVKTKQTRVAPLRRKEALLLTWSGMRGLVTLALVLSIPDGVTGFHSEMVVIILTVLLMTMVIPGFLLPWLMDKLDLGSESEAKVDAMRTKIASRARDAAMRSINREGEDLDPEVATSVNLWFELNLGAGSIANEAREDRIEMIRESREHSRDARRRAFRAAQRELMHLRHQRGWQPELVDEALAEIDRLSVLNKF